MIVMWPVYESVVLSCCCYLVLGCLGTEQLSPPAGDKYTITNDVKKNVKPNTFVAISYLDALEQRKPQGANGKSNPANNSNSGALPVQQTDLRAQTAAWDVSGTAEPSSVPLKAEEQEPAVKIRIFADRHRPGRHKKLQVALAATITENNDRERTDVPRQRFDRDFSDVWPHDASVVAVVVDPGRRVRMFARVDGDDQNAVDAGTVVDTETAEQNMTTAAVSNAKTEDGVPAIAALNFPDVDKPARYIVPEVREQQVLPLLLSMVHASSDVVTKRPATATHDKQTSQTTVQTTTRNVPSNLVDGHGNYASSRFYKTWKNVFPYDYHQYMQSLRNSFDSNSLEQQLVFEDEMYDYNNFKDYNNVQEDKYNDDDDVDDDDDDDDDYSDDDDFSDDDDDDDDYDDYDDDINYNYDISNKNDVHEVFIDYSDDDNFAEASKLDKIVLSKKRSDENSRIQLNFIKDMTGKQLVQYVNSLNIEQQGPIVGNQKFFEFLVNTMMKYNENDKNVSYKNISS